MILAGWPLPEKPQSREEANDRGFDPESLLHDRATPEPLTPEWQAALDGALRIAKHIRDPELDDELCGTRCSDCDERMCAIDGPAPRACYVTCDQCPCSCQPCLLVREDLRADLVHQLEREAR